MSSAITSFWIPCLITGIVAGIAAGLFGVGGGIIIVPILVLWFGYSQQTANGTSLVALLLPVGAFAVWNYWRSSKIQTEHVQVGLVIGAGIALGAIAGSHMAIGMNEETLKKAFAVFLVLIATRLWFSA